MARKKNKGKGDDKKDWWELWATRTGVVAGVVGLLLTGINLPNLIAQRGYEATRDQKTRVELDAVLRQRQEAVPRLEVSYLTFSPALHALLLARRKGERPSLASDNLLLGYPIAVNALVPRLFELPARMLVGLRAVDRPENVNVTFLLIQNRGKSDATSIELEGTQLSMPGTVNVVERPEQSEYVQALSAAAASRRPFRLAVPTTLAPTEGVLVPLFASDAFYTDSQGRTVWMTRSRVVFLPDSVHYTDPLDGSPHTIVVRHMQSPMQLSNGVVGRG
jgi:hypothetical protein